MYEQALVKLTPIYQKIDKGETLSPNEAKLAKALLAILIPALREHTPSRKASTGKGK